MFIGHCGSTARTLRGKYGTVAFAVVLVAVNAVNIFDRPPDSLDFMAIFSLVSYLAFGGIAFWLDEKRG